MKKIVTLAAIAALAGGMIFADEPVADVKVVNFTGNASVEWGVDLDAGKTGFKNSEEAKFRASVFSGGTKETSSDDDIWAELKIKVENADDTVFGRTDDGTLKSPAPAVDTAKFHIFNFYVGIRSGDTVTGAYKFDGAIRSADNDNAKWMSDVGPADYTQGIVAGYADDNFDFALDFRTRKGEKTYWTNDYAIALEAQLKDSNAFLPGLFVKLGGSVNLTDERFDNDGTTGKGTRTSDNDKFKAPAVNLNNAAKVLYLSDTAYNVWGYSAQAGYKLSLDDTYYVKPAVAFTGTTKTTKVNVSYSDKDNDAGKSIAGNSSVSIKYDAFETDLDLAFGALFGWGDTKDDNAGVPYLDGDMAKKVTPGVSVVVGLPLFTQTESKAEVTWNEKNAADHNSTSAKYTQKTTTDKPYLAIITPSFYSGSLINENLKIAAYSEIALMRGYESRPEAEQKTTLKDNTKKSDGTPVTDDVATIEQELVTNTHANPKNANNAFAFALGLSYDLKLDSVTVTPKFGVRFANGSYFDNGINAISPLSSNKVFEEGWGKMGVQRKVQSNGWGAANEVYAGDFLNLKLRCDVAGLLDNTTFWAEYASANLLNDINYKDEYIKANGDDKVKNPYYNGYAENGGSGNNIGWYNVRAGQFTVGTKISF